MNAPRDLAPVLDAVRIISPAQFLFRGETIPVSPIASSGLPGFPTHPLPDSPLVRDLQAVLYNRCYAHRLDQPTPEAEPQDPAFMGRLSAANQSQPRWEPGWTIYAAAPNGMVSLVKGDRQRNALPGEFITSSPPGAPLQVGAVVTVTVAREATNAQPGFYFAYGSTLSDVWDEHSLLRFYFHTSSTHAPALIGFLTGRLNRYQVPFRLKALSDPSLYGRTDAAVLYVARRYHAITVRLLDGLPPLHEAVPLFTRALRPGVGLAEEPNTGESFGMNRCRLVAEGIADAWRRGDQSLPGREAAIAARFTAAGCDLSRPHLSPDSADLPEIAQEVDFSHV